MLPRHHGQPCCPLSNFCMCMCQYFQDYRVCCCSMQDSQLEELVQPGNSRAQLRAERLGLWAMRTWLSKHLLQLSSTEAAAGRCAAPG